MAAVRATTRRLFCQFDHGIGKRGRPRFAGAFVDLSTRQPFTWKAAGLWNLVGSLAAIS
jgi:hypothetical protein